ncbi:hypothetical protein R9C00_01025 [Flammeovirgaceae bacterium SG7u.111]|nr:hypothetical protein [Flammeovirgaceae bacterium SG7u.132]WPO36030.1 hypothetical protein R9C00_01025 [Flammeovirgaceae bacterium SG7u.111]
MKRLCPLFLFLIFVGTISCTNSEIEFEENKVVDLTSESEARKYLGDYADMFFTATNGSMYIRTTGFGNRMRNDQEIEQGEIFARYNKVLGQEVSDRGEFVFDDLKMVYNEANGNYLPTEGSLSNEEKVEKIAPVFGKKSTVKLIRDGKVELAFEQYVPKKLVVEIPLAMAHSGSNSWSLPKSDFEIEWNKDGKNENGLLLYILWSEGSAVVKRVIRLEESGKAIIPKELFEGIPSSSAVELFFIRGSVDIKYLSEESFKFYGVAQYQITMVVK